MFDNARLVKKNLYVDNYKVAYYERNSNGKTLILLHGLGGNKNDFVKMVQYIPEDIHLILPDLAGHGENEKTLNFNYSIFSQAKLLQSFIDIKGINSVYIGGNSMGGHIALSFAINYPQKTKGIILINSAGISVPGNHAYSGYNIDINSPEEMKRSLEFGYYKVPELTKQEINSLMKEYNSSRKFIYEKIIPDIKQGKDYDLLKEISKISMPALIIWGKYDRVITTDVAKVFSNKIKKHKLELIDKSSHCPQNEKPEEIAKFITHFLNNNK